ncbi:TIGR03619 family F420-dependent LLM class oxidoreductase [Antrihabitans cavernicola]|uniref:TIGR03619 family F420-dependent LLM class oxidoreductase n=1 Tax=Antrihabitans cavernicola TaxID=2495913 RepID=A0A5A7SGS9_9NOCA|nr:TIGR03619 family F420-dependent LLM class oxidoreductase [Spelaeibacter cavernicola]KAA0024589.1 TIGR03619 family F420-dependent LLM class oxidoreductase [Spelaeibacter cavernicola]
MELGFGLPVSGSWATPRNIRAIATRADELGYATLWTFQRLLVAEAVPLGPQYASVLDPIAALGFAAAVTDRIRLGTAVFNMPFSSPALLGKQLATVDVLSNGRLDAGLGLGWSEDEFVAVGSDYAQRGQRAEDFVACLKQVWGADPVEYDGPFYRVPKSSVLPKPVQSAPPILLGGAAPAALDRVGRIADGWISSSRTDLAAIGEAVTRIKSSARDAGRDPESLSYVCRGVVVVGERKGPLSGSFDEIRGDLHELAEQGLTETFLDLNFDPAIGNPNADPAESVRRANELLDEFASGL